MTVAQVFQALGDPVRLAIVQRLARMQPCSIATVSEGLGMTRQGARKHLKVLADAKVIKLRRKGREVHVQLENVALDHARSFFEKLERQWDRRLEALKRSLEG